MTPERLAELRQMLAAATPDGELGEYFTDDSDEGLYSGKIVRVIGGDYRSAHVDVVLTEEEADDHPAERALIVALLNSASELLDAAERGARIEAAALLVSTKAKAVASCMAAEAQEDRALQAQGNLVGQIVFGGLVASLEALDAALAGGGA